MLIVNMDKFRILILNMNYLHINVSFLKRCLRSNILLNLCAL